ncbi:hypothetical protein D3C78_1887430 [compost metagenome]
MKTQLFASLIDDKALDLCFQHLDFKGFADVTVRTSLIAFDTIFQTTFGGQQQHGNMIIFGIGLNGPT